jgi:hypothetical protein
MSHINHNLLQYVKSIHTKSFILIGGGGQDMSGQMSGCDSAYFTKKHIDKLSSLFYLLIIE